MLPSCAATPIPSGTTPTTLGAGTRLFGNTANNVALETDVFAMLAAGPSYASDAAAKAGGIPIGGIYRNGSDIKIVVS